jgi:hypothetical protein
MLSGKSGIDNLLISTPCVTTFHCHWRGLYHWPKCELVTQISPFKISFYNLVEFFNDKFYSKFNISFNLDVKITNQLPRNPLIKGFSSIRIACLNFPKSFDFDFAETF